MIRFRPTNKYSKIIEPKTGFTLVEVLISVSLFSLIILSATNIFKLVIDSQRGALAAQNVQESLKYFLEVTGKEIRMAQKDEGTCANIPDDQIFVISTNSFGDVLSFKNYYDQCVVYALAADGDNRRFQVTRNTEIDFISPEKIRIDALQFVLNQSADTQPVITVNLLAYALNERQFKSEMTLQTSIASRYYRQ